MRFRVKSHPRGGFAVVSDGQQVELDDEVYTDLLVAVTTAAEASDDASVIIDSNLLGELQNGV